VPAGRLSFERVQPDENVSFIAVQWPGYHEFFCVMTSTDTVTILSFEPSDDAVPRIHQVPRPYRWDPGAADDDMLLQIWQVTGHQR